MDLRLDPVAGEGYPSRSQWARRVTEAWAAGNLYCVACPSRRIAAHGANTKVEDYHCPRCSRRLQLKAKNGRMGAQVANSAYTAKMEAIKANRAPDYGFLSYDREALRVTDLFVVPGHFLTSTVVARRNPLRPTARRAGWVGSSILLSRIPAAGKISVVAGGRVLSPSLVRTAFQATQFMQNMNSESRGWLGDVLACIDRLGAGPGDSFTLDDVYSFEGRLQALHPENHHVKPKIRQQLQVLRKRGLLEFVARGRYVKV